jgi:hypothetical protein
MFFKLMQHYWKKLFKIWKIKKSEQIAPCVGRIAIQDLANKKSGQIAPCVGQTSSRLVMEYKLCG